MNFQKLKEVRIPKVVHHRLACGGEARLSGSRVCVWNIIWNLNNGRTEEELLEDFPRLTPADIEVAKEYYRENKQEIDYDIYNHSQRRPIIEKLSDEKFKRMLENMSSDEVDKISASDFFGVLSALEAEEAEEIIELRGKVEDGEFVFEEPSPIPVFGNAIKIGNKQIVITLANNPPKT